jgi:8-oxo-dGTP pyrophosphatase MutT (NUDIX family)
MLVYQGMEKKLLTICFALEKNRILLGMKKRGWGVGCWNGFGGKVEEGEGIEEAMVRELKEECGIDALKFNKFGILRFYHKGDPREHEVHLFGVHEYSGEPVETEEMRPQWFSHNELPFDQMWEDDQYWLPNFIAGKCQIGHFWFNGGKLERHELKEVQKVD